VHGGLTHADHLGSERVADELIEIGSSPDQCTPAQ
jgi:hypothetical protein